MENLRCSIITICYNSVRTVTDTIESVVNQSYRNFEYIIIDGQSTDGTREIVASYAAKYHFIKLVSEPDKGIYNAMNKGIRMAEGDVVALLNSDDYYENNALELIVNAYENIKNKYFVIYGAVRFLKNGKECYSSINRHEFLPQRMIWHPACFVSKCVYDRYGLYDENYSSAADYELFLRCFNQYKLGNIQFFPVYQILVNFRMGGISSSYISLKEENEIKLKYSCISKKKYVFNLIKNYLTHLIYKN